MLIQFIDRYRIARVFMIACVTGASAYGFGADINKTIISVIFGALLSLSGFFLDYLIDSKKDEASGKTTNPLSSGKMNYITGLALVIISFLLSSMIAFYINPRILIFSTMVFVLIGFSNYSLLNTPFFRSVSLGLLQSLYVLSAGFFAGRFNSSIDLGVISVSLFLFFAMNGGRIMGEIRDLPYDRKIDSATIPIRYGMVFSLIFLWVNEIIAYSIGIISYWSAGFKFPYLICILLLTVSGIIINLLLTVKPTPGRADMTNRFSLGLLGSLYIAAMILGR